MKKFDVVALGELLVDFSMNNDGSYVANAGGAPCNVLAMLNNLGKSVSFIGKVGNDKFGKELVKTIKNIGIDASGIVFDNDVNTTITFVSNDDSGERHFTFYRNPGADMMLKEDEIDFDILSNAKMFHFGSLSMTDEPARSATKKAVDAAEKFGSIISFDPNYREMLWNDIELAKECIIYGMEKADLIKLSLEEALLITDENSLEKAKSKIGDRFYDKLVFITLGAGGSVCIQGDEEICQTAYINSNPIDTTGAGDCYCACVLNGLLDRESLNRTMEKASKASSILVGRKGALESMPSREEIEGL